MVVDSGCLVADSRLPVSGCTTQTLAEALKVAEPVIDICFAYRVQGPDAIEPLLEVAQAEGLSWKRQARQAEIDENLLR